jgi:hypothetical protein
VSRSSLCLEVDGMGYWFLRALPPGTTHPTSMLGRVNERGSIHERRVG